MSTNREDDSDLATLHSLNNEEILSRLKKRFYEDKIYTYIGDVLIAVNPYKNIPHLYDTEQIDYCETRDLPHIYWTAEESYDRLHKDQTNQCILVTGDSGAGKTESTKYILKHLTARSQCEIEDLVKKLNRVNPLIELFGNASTTLNNNSSRFVKLIELSYEGRILIGGAVRTFMVEKSRVVQHKPSEKNFHIFYAFFAGYDEQELEYQYSLKQPSTYRIMVGDKSNRHSDATSFWEKEEKQQYRERFSKGCEILREIDFKETEIREILDILAACLHLGNIKFEEMDDNTYGVTIVDGEDGDKSLRRAIPLLGLDAADENVVSEIKDIFTTGPPICFRGEKTPRRLSEIQAADVRDSIVKALYLCVFNAIIDQINESIKEKTNFIGDRQLLRILDISGFERLIENNSLEQLFINITNEKMHRYLQEQIFILENKEYVNEEIHMPANTFHDKKPVIDLIFKKPGILSIFDDQTLVSSSDGARLVTEYNKEFTESKKVDAFQRGGTESFTIVHYAGPVKYNAREFLEKNRGTVPQEIKEILTERSNNCIVSEYFNSRDSISSNRDKPDQNKSVKNERPLNSEAIQFRKSVDCLVEILEDGEPLFVCCIKSNDNQQAGCFDEKVVLEQMKSVGMDDIFRIRSEGYPSRESIETFMTTCQVFLEPNSENDQTIDRIFQTCNIFDEVSYKIGKTKVFMKGHVFKNVMQKRKALLQKEKQRKEEENEKKRKEEEKEKERKEEEKEIERKREQKQKQEKEIERKREQKQNQKTTRPQEIDQLSTHQDHHCSQDLQKNTRSASIRKQTDTVIEMQRNTVKNDTSDEDNQIEGNEDEKWIYDVFRNRERNNVGCAKVEKVFLKLCRFIICVGLLVGITAKGIAITIIPLLLASQLNTDKEESQRSNALTELILCYSTPIALTFIQSLFKVCFGSVKHIGWKIFLPVLISEVAEVCGTSYLLFKVFHNHSMTSGITFNMAAFTLPSILNILKQINLALKKNQSEKHIHKLAIRLSRVVIAFIAMFIQVGSLVCMIVQPNIIFSDKMSIQTHFTTGEKFLIVGSLVGVSMGFCQNFLLSWSSDTSSEDWRADADEARPNMNLKLCIIKIGLFLVMAKCLLPEISWTLTEEHANLKDNFVDKIVKIFRQHQLMFIYIYCVIFISYEGVLACKLNMQRISFFIPLTLVPLGCLSGVIGYCYEWSEETNLFGVAVSCPSVDINSISMWLGSSAALWVSIICLSWHVLFPTCIKMEQDQRLFVLPTRDSLFSSLGLLMKRKDESFDHKLFKREKEEPNEKRKKARPYIYICGTMWHETRQEMLQLLKSLFRLDDKQFYEEGDICFDKEIHIIFDDAFKTDKNNTQRIPNGYVEKLVECMEEASTSHSMDPIQWVTNKSTKITTPYGEQLKWTMPCKTEMTIHLKDKEKIRHKKRWSQIMYMYYLLGYKMLAENGKYCKLTVGGNALEDKMKEIKEQADNTFILALDGDVDFKPEAIQKLIHKMKTNEKVGAVCGRIHPIGSGPVVWYQQFEYAIGHWLQKATEHVFGCVLCCPGAFSLFRASALIDDNVLRRYTSPPVEARHFIQYEQGEDRWLCTLMLQQGWKIDYAASADAFTFAPETFEDFFVQRRRWAPSTLANIIDLLSSWRVTTKENPNISTLFVFYQFILFSSSLLGLGTVTLMITGSFNAVLKITLFQSYVVAVTPVAVYAIICIKCSNDKQIAAAALLSTVYTLVMVIVTVGLFVNIASEKTYSPNVIFFVEILCIFLFAGLAHPKELMCLAHGLLYYLMVPSTFIFLTVYYMCNIHVVSWGTREKKTQDEAVSSTNSKKSPTVSILTFIKKKLKLKQLFGGRVEQQANVNETESPVSPVPSNVPSCPEVSQDCDAWPAMNYLGPGEKTMDECETEFWSYILKKYLHPLVEDSQKKKEIQIELKSLRNNVALGFLLINFLFATAVFQLQNNTDQLKNVYILNEYEPLSIVFLLVFALVILLQFIGMLIHRWGTFLHLISSASLWPSPKGTGKKLTKTENCSQETRTDLPVSNSNSTQRLTNNTGYTKNKDLRRRKDGSVNNAYTD